MTEKKTWIEIILMPIVVASVGMVGTYLITSQQEENARTVGDAQLKSAVELAFADRQIKVLEIFSEKIASTDQEQRILALNILRAVDPDLASKLALAVSEAEPQASRVKEVAQQVAKEARAQIPARIYVHIREEEDRSQAQSIEQHLEAGGFDVPGIQKVGRNAPQASELRYFRRSDKPEATQIVERLKPIGVESKLNYISGYENSRAIPPRHYELWLAPNPLG